MGLYAKLYWNLLQALAKKNYKIITVEKTWTTSSKKRTMCKARDSEFMSLSLLYWPGKYKTGCFHKLDIWFWLTFLADTNHHCTDMAFLSVHCDKRKGRERIPLIECTPAGHFLSLGTTLREGMWPPQLEYILWEAPVQAKSAACIICVPHGSCNF